MNEDLIADLWQVVVGHIPDKQKDDVAAEFVNTLLDYGIKESVLESLLGVDPHLDGAVEYAIDDEVIDDDDDEYYED